MGKAKKGIHGPVTGKVGNLVYTTWRGIEVVKTAPVRNAPPTEREAANRTVFDLSNQWLSPLTPFLRIGFKNYTPTNQGFTAAKSYLSKNALIKTAETPYIDPALMLVSYGDLPLAESIQVSMDEEKQLTFTWDTTVTTENSPLDQVLLLAYNVEQKQAAMILGGNFRKDGSASLPLKFYKPGNFHVYLAFVAEDRSRQSDSAYLGVVSVPAQGN